jgi:hypothetical protein
MDIGSQSMMPQTARWYWFAALAIQETLSFRDGRVTTAAHTPHPYHNVRRHTVQTLTQFIHRPIRVRVQFPGSTRSLLSFIETEDDADNFEAEVKRMIQLNGMVAPQYDAVAIESWE